MLSVPHSTSGSSFGSGYLPTPPPSASHSPRKRSYSTGSDDQHDSPDETEPLANRKHLLGLIASHALLSDTGIPLSNALSPLLEPSIPALVDVKEHYDSGKHGADFTCEGAGSVRTVGASGPTKTPQCKVVRFAEPVDELQPKQQKITDRRDNVEELVEEVERLWIRLKEKGGGLSETSG